MPKAVGTQNERLSKLQFVQKQICSKREIERERLLSILAMNFGTSDKLGNSLINRVIVYLDAKEVAGVIYVTEDSCKKLTETEESILKA